MLAIRQACQNIYLCGVPLASSTGLHAAIALWADAIMAHGCGRSSGRREQPHDSIREQHTPVATADYCPVTGKHRRLLVPVWVSARHHDRCRLKAATQLQRSHLHHQRPTPSRSPLIIPACAFWMPNACHDIMVPDRDMLVIMSQPSPNSVSRT